MKNKTVLFAAAVALNLFALGAFAAEGGYHIATASRARHSSGSGYTLGAEASRVRHSAGAGYGIGSGASRARHESAAKGAQAVEQKALLNLNTK